MEESLCNTEENFDHNIGLSPESSDDDGKDKVIGSSMEELHVGDSDMTSQMTQVTLVVSFFVWMIFFFCFFLPC